MTGNRTAHPLLLGLANVRMNVRMKYSNNAFVLCALLPVANFIHPTKRMRGVLNDRLLHQSLDVVLEPLKIAARIGIMMSDPLGRLRFCFTPLAAYIADTQEAIALSCVCGKTSPVTMAMYKQFGDSFRHESRSVSTTLAQLQSVNDRVNPRNLHEYFSAVQEFRLNGVDKPFWRDWDMADPARFLTPEPLHHWHRQFWDHDAQWCIHALGAQEIDFRFSILPCAVGFRHFREGISKLKQVTGREQRDMQRYMVCVIAGAVSKDFLIAIRALMDFRYLSQAPTLDDDICRQIKASLREFHDHKLAIIDAGARRGKKGKSIDNWYIPKLELMQSVEPSIRDVGAIIQWSADLTEHAHITEIKDPARSVNNQQYNPQICRYLDRREKRRLFAMATSTRDAELKAQGASLGETELDDESDVENAFANGSAPGLSRAVVNYFSTAKRLEQGLMPGAPRPYRTFSVLSTAFHLSRDPTCKMLIDDAAQMFCIPDLRPALADYLYHINRGQDVRMIGGRRIAPVEADLPFDNIQIWHKVRMQVLPYHSSQDLASPRTLHASPASSEWPRGRFDTALINNNPSFNWPHSGIVGT